MRHIKTLRPPGSLCSPHGLFQKDVTLPWLGLFPTCVILAFCMLSTTMQILQGTHAKMQSTLSLSHFLPHTFGLCPSHWLYGCSLFDVFPCWMYPPPVPFFSSSLPSFASSLSAVFCPASLHAWPALPWLLTSKSYFIHQSLIRERGPFSASLKEKEGTRSECIKKRGNKCMKRGHKRERGFALDPWGTSGVTKAKKGHTPTHLHTVTTACIDSVWVSTLKCTLTCTLFLFWSAWMRADAANVIPSSFFCLSYLVFPLILFHWQYKEESRPVPFCNPSLHLDVCTIVCCLTSFPHCSHFPAFLNLALCIFILFVSTDILPLFSHFSILRWLAN